ncbi:hypothetical protein NDU88_007475 [Pleurodeles waltl]|uniref:Uncharacterized protein n=1 Tax=Pleurodeles waltl TaxID=8319 RepID=A0AAV7NWC1_PLEWA|nr:hypothetical protein NDU88_007475 [Pleurodeles waltl]
MGRFCVPWYKVDGVMEKRQAAQQKYVQTSQETHRRKFDWKVGDAVKVKCPRSTGLSKFSSGKRCVGYGFFRALLVLRAVEPTRGEPRNIECEKGFCVMLAVGAGDPWKEDGSKKLS